MRQISRPRIFLGGLLAGVGINSLQYLIESFAFPTQWDGTATALNKIITAPTNSDKSPEITTTLIIAVLQVLGLLVGMLAVRFYAKMIRDRKFMSRVAALVGICIWVLIYVPICAVLVVLKFLSNHEAAAFAVTALVACIGGTLLGTWIYSETQASGESAAKDLSL